MNTTHGHSERPDGRGASLVDESFEPSTPETATSDRSERPSHSRGV